MNDAPFERLYGSQSLIIDLAGTPRDIIHKEGCQRIGEAVELLETIALICSERKATQAEMGHLADLAVRRLHEGLHMARLAGG